MSGNAFRVVYTPDALEDLASIWRWNVKTYSRSHATSYIKLLRRHINDLCDDPQRGRIVESRPDLRYLLIKIRSRGHGHVVVYRVRDNKLEVSNVFHSAQDWQRNLAGYAPHD